MRSGILFAGALVGLLLSGCGASAVGDELVTSTVDVQSVPGFVAEEQDEEDVISAFDVATFGVDPDTTRYQGEWEGEDFQPGISGYDVYLGLAGSYTVHLITVPVGHPDMWGSGSSDGNTVVGLGEPITLQYLPQGTAVPPEGWHALSDWIIVRD